MILNVESSKLVRVLRCRRVDSSLFDNWYIHCPKCGSLLVQHMGAEGPAWLCWCGRERTGVGGGSQKSVVGSQ